MRGSAVALWLAALVSPAGAQPAPAAPADPPASTPDDLARAADATAEVANLPPAGAAAAAPDPAGASSDAIDLNALGLDPAGSAATFDDKLNIYGFADINWQAARFGHKLAGLRQNTVGFFVGNLNLYLAKNLTSKARALAEVRFTFLPNGGMNADGTSVSAVATDPTNSTRPQQWGGIVIERAYIEYDLTDHLTVRAGHWLTPYGVWNIDHGSPAIIAVTRPYIIGEQFFPEHQTGLQLFGNHYLGDYKLNYHLTASNGRGAAESQQDQDNDVALGGRLDLETPLGLRLGASYYEGRYTGFAAAPGAAPPTYHEMAYSADAQFDRGGLHVQGEISIRDRHFEDGERSASAAGFIPDGRDFGCYVLAGYRFDRLWNVMPFAYYEHYRPQDRVYFRGIDDVTGGLNFRPAPTLVVKLQGVYARFADGPELLGGMPYSTLSAQAAWMF